MERYRRLGVFQALLRIVAVLGILWVVFDCALWSDSPEPLIFLIPAALFILVALALADLIDVVVSTDNRFYDTAPATRRESEAIEAQLKQLTQLVNRLLVAQMPEPDGSRSLPGIPVPGSPPDAGEPYVAPADSLAGQVIVDRAMLRTRPGPGAPIYRVVLREKAQEFTGRSADRRWLRVHSSGGSTVWIDLADVEVQGDPASLPVVPPADED